MLIDYLNMTLYLNGRDIYVFVIGHAGAQGQVVDLRVVECAPEERLAVVDAYLVEHGIARHAVTRLVVVEGPGSATALRAMLTLANTWKMLVLELETVGIQSGEELQVTAQRAVFEKALKDAVAKDRLVPVYEHAVRITAPTRDRLKRKL